MNVYMDYGAARPVDPRVLEAMKPYFTDHFGNPSSFHTLGFGALTALNEAREQVASLIGAQASEIVFTSSATESNNLGIIGAATRYRKKGNRIVVSEIEHISVLNICKELSRQGFEIEHVPVDNEGILTLDSLAELVDDETVLVSIMAANGEIGTIQPIKEAAEITHGHDALFHTDATAAAGQMSLDASAMGIDLMTLSSNDLYGPKGVGGLYVRQGTPLAKWMDGGFQEFNLRAGEENIPAAVGFAKAVELVRPEETARLREMRDRLVERLLEIPHSRVNGHPTQRLPHNANVSFRFVEGESILLHLDMRGFAVSTGSACFSRSLEASHVILGIGGNHERAHGSVRFTFGRYNTMEDVEAVVEALTEVVASLRAISPLGKE